MKLVSNTDTILLTFFLVVEIPVTHNVTHQSRIISLCEITMKEK